LKIDSEALAAPGDGKAAERVSPLTPVLPAGPGDRRIWRRLYGGARGLAICRAAEASAGLTVVLTADIKSAERLLEELHFYRNAAGDLPLMLFPDWETLPYDRFSPYQDIISERLGTLAGLPVMDRGILVGSVSTIMHRLIPAGYLQSTSLLVKTGQRLVPDQFRGELARAGYRVVPQVNGHGDIAFRGSLLDIYPMGAGHPFRIDLFDEVVDSIRTFDPETQRSSGRVQEIRVLPASEVSLAEDSINRFRSNWRQRFPGNPAKSTIYRDVSDGIAPAGIEYYLPLFYESTGTIFDYVSGRVSIILDEGVQPAAESFWQDACNRYQQYRHDVERPLLPPEEIFLPAAELFAKLKAYPRVELEGLKHSGAAGTVHYTAATPVRLPVDVRGRHPLAVLQKFLAGFNGRVLLVAESAGRRETLLDMLRPNNLVPDLFDSWSGFFRSDSVFGLTVAPLEQGMLIDSPKLAIISETELFGERAQQRRLRGRRKSDADALIRNLAELTVGAPVVHEENGVGRYQGLITLEVDGVLNEFLHLEYDRGDRLYVPVSSLDRISRYTGVDPEHAPLHRLGSSQWQKAKQRAEKKVFDVAAELLELHARRAARSGYAFVPDEQAYNAFAQGFPFEETPDQLEAITAVLEDMQAPAPMDRLICGDAGFGKTEVAMRAAFVAVNNNRQVAMLVPTTLLAQQHFQNFRDRFADWPVRIEVLSRFVGRKQQNTIIRDLAEGRVDIVIGTHKLLQDSIRFHRLGLVIIDEEHRFGVRQKEKFKALRSEVDLLTLTATPIPRTLNMALSDIRDLSIIASPPLRRLAVKTFVHEWQDDLLREAVLREIKRGGQVYFLHNDIDSIERRAATLQSLVPECRVQVAHGRMPEKQLEQVMLDFYHRRFNVLVCTTIIETGIDVPTANTIIIERADRFGLAQLYQLRGRVGRSHHRAYAYLVVPPDKSMTGDAIKRLEAITSLEDLGIGFTLATHDLEIRGAGEILGEEQSGQIHEIGFALYMDLLERAVRAMKSGRHPQLDRPLDHGAEIDLHIPALIPEDYLPDVHARLIMYKQIAGAGDRNQLQFLREEMIDRFGLLPEPAQNLFQVTELKLSAGMLGIRKIDLGTHGGRIHFDPGTSVDPEKIIRLVQGEPSVYKFAGPEKLRVVKQLPDPETRISFLREFIEIISTRDAA